LTKNILYDIIFYYCEYKVKKGGFMSFLVFTDHQRISQELSDYTLLTMRYDDNYFKELFIEFMSSNPKAFCSPRVNLGNFPIPKYFLEKELEVRAKLFYFGNMPISFAKEKILDAGYRPAMALELLAFGLKIGARNRNFMVASLDPLFEDSVGNLFYSAYRETAGEQKISIIPQRMGLPEHSFVLGIDLETKF